MKKHKSLISRSLFLISILLVMCAPVLAQHASDGLGAAFGTPSGAAITKSIVYQLARRSRERRPANGRPAPSSTTRTSLPTSAQPIARLNESSVLFRSTGTQLKTREIANLIDAGNPQVLKLLTALLEEFDKGARAAGHPSDLALALSFFLATNASIYHDAGQPADPPMVELRDMIATALVEDNALNGITDRKKQEMYEALVIFTGFALATYEEGKQGGNAETVKVSQQLAGQNLLAVIGISPDKISFTNQGLNIETEAADVTSTPQSNTEPNVSRDAPATQSSSDFLDFDPFPDKPHVQAQKPLIGRLRKTITMADLAGTWEIGGASVQEYVSSSTQSYSSVSFFGKKYSIRSDGTYNSSTQARASNTTIRETDSGTIILDGGFITMKSKQNPAMRYQFVAFMNQPNGAAVISLIYLNENAPLDGNALRANCSHANGYVSCLNGEEWVRIP
jgi:hypothetical protein